MNLKTYIRKAWGILIAFTGNFCLLILHIIEGNNPEIWNDLHVLFWIAFGGLMIWLYEDMQIRYMAVLKDVVHTKKNYLDFINGAHAKVDALSDQINELKRAAYGYQDRSNIN